MPFNFFTTNLNILLRTLLHTVGVHPKIKHKCLYPMVLPIKNRKRPNWAVGFISWGLPVLWCCSPKNSTSCRIVKAFLVMPVIVRNDDASPWWYNFAHGDSSGKSTAQWCSFVRFRTELLAWTSTTTRQKYNTCFRVLTSIGWLPSVQTQTKKWRVFFWNLYRNIQFIRV